MSSSALPIPSLAPPPTALTTNRVFKTWWPLALGWLIMTVEIPGLSAIIARLAEPQLNLAAWGVVFPLALILAAPVMMMLSASTALSKDWASYARVRRYMWGLSALLTLLHALLAYTPLYYLVVEQIIAVPPAIVEPARIGLQIMLPWSAALAYRRFTYGLLIRFGHTGWVTMGAVVRLGIDAVAITLLLLVGGLSGIVVATVAITCGVIGEALYAGWRVRRVLTTELKSAPPVAQTLTLVTFLQFYLPLVMTSFLQVVVQPITSAALSRMPDPLTTLAVWPVVYGLLIIWMSAGMAYTETVVVLLDEPQATPVLHRFTVTLGALTASLLLIMAATPLADLWFHQVAALPDELAVPAKWALLLSVIAPGLAVIQSWHQGVLMNERRTRGITEATFLSLLSHVAVLVLGVWWGALPGLYVGICAVMAGHLLRTGWLWWRTRSSLRTRRTAQLVPAIGD